ncbi:Manganese transporter SMF2 [Spathaspora sp. JA1]|nr:Manganese transporter SMF2 [Spathaspora sp. JA1]
MSSFKSPLFLTSLANKLHIKKILSIIKTYGKFIGPGLMVSVAYMDPGNYSTAVAAGSAYKYNLLFSIFLSNCLAIFLQILAAKLGAVTGLDLAANCKANFTFKTNLVLYILTEIAIIATDLAEVVGTAIALNILFKVPLFLGVLITVVDVLIVLMAYRPKGPLLFIRIFESFVSVLVGATVVCFAIELYQVSHDSSINFSVSEIFMGFLPNPDVVDMSDRKGGNGLFLSLAILGATVMPHSLYLGSGLVQARLKDFDVKHGLFKPLKVGMEQPSIASSSTTEVNQQEEDYDLTPLATPYIQDQYEKEDELTLNVEDEDDDDNYRPSVHAIDHTMSYTIIELVVSLFTVALFVNAAILIVAGATLHDAGNTRRDDDEDSDSDSDDDASNNSGNADLFTIYNLLTRHLSPTAGFVFALALLCSGQSAGVVCTLAGQMVSEGFLNWSLSPVVRRLITRALAIAPCLLVVSVSGREGLAKTLNASQVVLSILLPVVTAPLIMFTCNKEIMSVPVYVKDGEENTIFEVDTESQEPRTKLTQKRFKSTDSAILLQDLRNSHPCAGWEDDDLDHEHQPRSEEQRRLIETAASEQAYSNHTMMKSDSLTSTTTTTNNTNHELPIEIFENDDHEVYRVQGYKDFSNGPMTAFLAIVIWGFITVLNLYLIGSMILGYDVPL